jgi:hypothetical protein
MSGQLVRVPVNLCETRTRGHLCGIPHARIREIACACLAHVEQQAMCDTHAGQVNSGGVCFACYMPGLGTGVAHECKLSATLIVPPAGPAAGGTPGLDGRPAA